MATRRKEGRFDLAEPGDWVQMHDLDRDATVYWLRIWCGHDAQLVDHAVSVGEDGESLTVSPSIVCPLGDNHPQAHGHLRGGEWVPAGPHANEAVV